MKIRQLYVIINVPVPNCPRRRAQQVDLKVDLTLVASGNAGLYGPAVLRARSLVSLGGAIIRRRYRGLFRVADRADLADDGVAACGVTGFASELQGK